VTTTQIKDNPVSLETLGSRLSPSPAIVTRIGLSEVTKAAAVESLLLGVRLRGWLADRDKEFLDNLTPDRSIAFLIHGKRYLHPEGVRLFPHEMVESAIAQGGEALFSHRYRPGRSHADGYTIHTALINPSEENPLVIGYFGPDNQLSHPETHDRFFKLVSQFRQAYRLAGQVAQELAVRQEAEVPTAIINRCSGRVVAVNGAAETLLRISERRLVDLEFGQLKSRLMPILTSRRLKITNVSRENLYLSVITILPDLASRDRRGSGTDEFFVEVLRSKSADIVKTVKRLETLSDRIVNEEITALSGAVAKATRELDLYIARLRFLWHYDRLAPGGVDLLEELRQALGRVVSVVGSKRSIEIGETTSGFEVRAPRGALLNLFESILLSHLSELDVPGNTNISLEKHPAARELVIVFETDTFPVLAENSINPECLSYAKELAARMGVRLADRESVQDYKVITGVTVNL